MNVQPATGTPPAAERSIALVGRPNVGKSAVFNRIAGKRIAIVFGEPGVTRDRLERDVEWGGARFRLADTGGILALDGERLPDRIDAGVVAQARAAIGGAGAVVMVVDAQEGLHPLDLEVARLLRKAGADAIVAANKADNEALDAHAADFARLGFPVFPVSALHGRGFDALMSEALRRLPPEPGTPGDPDAPDAPDGGAAPAPDKPVAVAIAGRPNCGKSSFVNRLLKTERLIVSDVPGTTRDPIDVPFEYGGRSFTLIDTAGVRREARVDTAVERYSRFRTQDALERADLVVLMLESQRGAGLLDRQLAGMVADSGKSCVIAVNKWDLEHPSEREFLEKLAQDLPFMAHCPVVFLSAKTGFRVERVLATVAHVADAARATLPTGPLNRCLHAACEAAGGAASGRAGRPLKFYYAAQTGFNPVRIRLFVNDPGRMPASLEAFLAGALRREFDLAGVGVLLQFRARRRKDGSTAERAPAPGARGAKKANGKARPRRRRMARG